VGVVLLIAATTVAALGGVAITSLLRPHSRIDAVVTFGLVTSAVIAIAIEVPGWLGVLNRPVVLTVVVAIAACAVVVARRRHRLHAPSGTVRDAVAVLRSAPITAVMVVAAGVAMAWQTLVAVVLTPYAYDALTYHLLSVVTWIQHESFAKSALDTCCAHYPKAPELFFAWPMLMTSSDSVVNLVQLAFIVLGAFAVAGIARSAGAERAVAILCGAAFAVTPVVLAQGPTEFVDVMITAWALAGLHSLVRFASTADLQRLVPVALASGLLLGSKGTGVIWAIVLGLAVTALGVWHRRARRILVRDALGGAVIFVTACAVLGSFWYVRNWIDHGNPVYPFRVQVFDTVVFDGPSSVGAIESATTEGDPSSWPERTLRSWAKDLDFWHQDTYAYGQRSGGLGPVWAWLGAPLLALVALSLARRRDASDLGTALAVAVVGLVFLVQPYRWWSRFTMPLAAIGLVAIAVAIAWRRVGRLIAVATVGLAIAGAVITVKHVDPSARARPARATRVLELAGSPRRERSAPAVFFPEYRFVDDIEDDATVVADIAADELRFVYLLFGDDIDRSVVRYRRTTDVRDAWVVTARGRRADTRAAADGEHVLVSDRRGLRAWKPRSSS
jgi:hypothetical protein